MPDSPAAIARDLIAEVGRADALAYLRHEASECETDGEREAVRQLLAAVARA